MAKSWYIVQVFTSYEKKIEKEIADLLMRAKKFPESASVDTTVLLEVKVPERLVQSRDKEGKLKLDKQGKPKMKAELVMPGYVMVQMDLPESGWKKTCTAIRSIRGVNGFVGTDPNERPRPIRDDEAKKIFMQTGEMKDDRSSYVQSTFAVGDKVKMVEGAFATFNGTVVEVQADKNKLIVNVEIFGRDTPVDVDVSSVEKI